MFTFARGNSPLTKSGKLKVFFTVLSAGFALAALYCCVSGALHGYKFPYGSLLFNSERQFGDFYDNWFKWQYDRQFLLSRSALTVLPLGNVLMYAFSRINPAWTALFIFSALGAAFFVCYCFWGTGRLSFAVRAAAVIALCGLCYPFLFTLDRGNMQLYYFMLVSAFLYAYSRGAYAVAAAIFGFSLGLKPFHIVFAVLFVADRKYRELAAAFCVFALTAAGASALLAVWNGLTVNQFLHPDPGPKGNWTVSYHQAYVVGNNGLFFGHSVFGALKVVLMHFYNCGLFALGTVEELVERMARPYFVAAAAGYLYAAWFVIRRETVLWRRVALLTVCMTALPFVSADYRLTLYLIPFFMFLNAPGENTDFVYSVLFGLVLIPKNYYFRVFSFVPPDTGLGIVATPAVLLYFAWRLMRDRRFVTGAGVKAD
ncbi:MAG: glycosyltransferase 87 family protein [Elusimicrobiaceae bacterium]|nr:glycosyltransferase 87 family protein [Elusimicrobiaceae bacterium]